MEPIYECLAAAKLLPDQQKATWKDFWNTATAYFVNATGRSVAHVAVHDDGKHPYIELAAEDGEIMQRVEQAVIVALMPQAAERKVMERALRLYLTASDFDTKTFLEKGAQAAKAFFLSIGLHNPAESKAP